MALPRIVLSGGHGDVTASLHIGPKASSRVESWSILSLDDECFSRVSGLSSTIPGQHEQWDKKTALRNAACGRRTLDIGRRYKSLKDPIFVLLWPRNFWRNVSSVGGGATFSVACVLRARIEFG